MILMKMSLRMRTIQNLPSMACERTVTRTADGLPHSVIIKKLHHNIHCVHRLHCLVSTLSTLCTPSTPCVDGCLA